jgi:EmrB/QacA subfamily drug resistance transporter
MTMTTTDQQVGTDDPTAPALSALGVAVLLCGAILPMLDMFIVNVALPSIKSDLSASAPMLELIIAGYGTAYALLLTVGGRLGDAYGRRTVFMAGLVSFTLSSLLCGLAPNIDVLIMARIVQGAAAALIIPQVLGTFRTTLIGHRQGKAIGSYGATAGVAAVAGQLVGGLLIAANIAGYSWRPIFIVNVPIGIFTMVAAWRLVPNTRSEHPASVDLPGTVLFGVTMVSLLIPLTEGESVGWPTWTWIVLAISPLAAVATYLVERRSEQRSGSPLLPPSLFAVRSMRRGSTLAVPYFICFGAFMFVYSLTIQDGLHESALHSGLAISPFAFTFLIGTFVVPRLFARYGRMVFLVSGIVQSLAMASLAGVFVSEWPHVRLLDLQPSLAVAGFVGAGIFVSAFRLVLADVPLRLAGVGSGVFVTMQQSSYALGVATLGTLFLSMASDHTADGFAWVVAIWAAIDMCIAAGSFILPRVASRKDLTENVVLENAALEV